MRASGEEINRNIQFYQKCIEINLNEGTAQFPLIRNCIEKLDNMPIEVLHLQATGVGKTINSLRALAGEIEKAATALVWKWKILVADQQITDTEPEDEDQSSDEEITEDSSRNSSAEVVNETITTSNISMNPTLENPEKQPHFGELDGENVGKRRRDESEEVQEDLTLKRSKKDLEESRRHRFESSNNCKKTLCSNNTKWSNDQRSYECKKCDYRALNQTYLNIHYHLTHAQKGDSQRDWYHCCFCDFRCVAEHYLYEHQKRKHTNNNNR